jgi:hypothetical protein
MSRTRPRRPAGTPHRFDEDPELGRDHRSEPFCRCERPKRNAIHVDDASEYEPVVDDISDRILGEREET